MKNKLAEALDRLYSEGYHHGYHNRAAKNKLPATQGKTTQEEAQARINALLLEAIGEDELSWNNKTFSDAEYYDHFVKPETRNELRAELRQALGLEGGGE